jgi:hypothetical protein
MLKTPVQIPAGVTETPKPRSGRKRSSRGEDDDRLQQPPAPAKRLKSTSSAPATGARRAGGRPLPSAPDAATAATGAARSVGAGGVAQGERDLGSQPPPPPPRSRPVTTVASLPDTVITNGVFSFLDQSEHVRFGRTSKAFLRLGRLPAAWQNKSVELKYDTTDEELARFCVYARPARLSLCDYYDITDQGLGHLAPLLPSLIELNLSYCTGVTDVSALGGVHTLDLTWTDVNDVSALGGVHTLDLSWCKAVTDVSALGGVTTLTLKGCRAVTDVSALGNVTTLDLSQTGVVDVSALGGVHELFVGSCPAITDVSALGGVHSLYLSRCTGVTDVSALGNVTKLGLYGCTGVTDVSSLGGVNTLFLNGCTGVTDVSDLGGVTELDLSNCPGVIDVSALGGVNSLDISGCTDVTDVSALGCVQTLIIAGCVGMTDVSALGGVQTLNLYGCTGVSLTNASALVGVKRLTLPHHLHGRVSNILAKECGYADCQRPSMSGCLGACFQCAKEFVQGRRRSILMSGNNTRIRRDASDAQQSRGVSTAGGRRTTPRGK